MKCGACPGFGQDRVNFHWNPGRDTARRADPTWPNRAGYSIPCAIMLGFGGGGAGRQELSRGSGGRSVGRGGRLCCAECFVLFILLICTVVVTVPSVCCSVKLPLSRPTSFCRFLSILLRTVAGGGAAAWHFCCRPQSNHNRETPSFSHHIVETPKPQP